MPVYTPCDILAVLTTYQQQILEKLTAKFNSLRRLAILLEQAGDISPVLGAIISALPQLPPLSFFTTLDAYDSIRFACPMLNLPPVDISQAADLFSRIAAAYSALLQALNLHQYNRMDKLQARIDELIGQAEIALGRDWQLCATAVCKATQNLRFTELRTEFSEEIQSAENLSQTTGAVVKPFQVLTPQMQDKVSTLKKAQLQVQSLFDASAPVSTSQ